MKQSRTRPLNRTFLLIQSLMALLLLFVGAQAIVQWHLSRQGMSAMHGLEQEGLPSLSRVADLEASLLLYRLRSYELMFVDESQRAAKGAETDRLHQDQRHHLDQLNGWIKDPEGRRRLNLLDQSLQRFAAVMARVRSSLDQDFQGAMEILDKEVPLGVRQLEESALLVKEHCAAFAALRTQQTVQAFTQTQQAVVLLGSLSAAFAAAVLVLVAFSSSRIRHSLTVLAGHLAAGSSETTASAHAVASASQALAAGASRQAASIEATSSSLESLATMVRQNANAAQQANTISGQTRAAADAGTSDIDAMRTSMAAIKHSSDEVAKIVKNIDEIAFQTNILALNAAVEAARASDAGAGFAVVADEVRSLAQRSAQAARESTSRIEDAIQTIEQGVTVTNRVAGRLQEIILKARSVDDFVGQIASASQDQAQGIDQISQAVTSMDRVTQSNAAAADESAEASQALNDQATRLKDAVDGLLSLVGGCPPQPVPTHTDPDPDPIHGPSRRNPEPFPTTRLEDLIPAGLPQRRQF